MRLSLTASLLLALGLMNPIGTSLSLSEDLEGSGYDLEGSGSGSGSGDWSEEDSPGDITNIKDHSNSKDGRIVAVNAGGGNKNTFHGSSDLTFDNWPAEDNESGFVMLGNSKSFLENKEILAGVIAGGVMGVALAATLAAILIYKWQTKDEEGYVLGQQKASVEDYPKPIRDEVIV